MLALSKIFKTSGRRGAAWAADLPSPPRIEGDIVFLKPETKQAGAGVRGRGSTTGLLVPFKRRGC